ncbi:Predicted dienelactone hydrolase [Legionella pneumophila]|uniref:Glycoside hydrolase/deacetylase, beta/alpha-barrel n=11 Tax=Legionellaceae TaxID=444 RepID=A0A378KLE6_9GAMM|nr:MULTISPECIES: alpha/beta fold hydrolase [Legionellaceae]AMV16139.1 Polysaccharide deacetylase [Legionella pneumophila]AUH74085.1 alpha/beta fold hydrolase [Legionella sainthelensi]KTC67630.1 polysaccharide deacetylase [Legionella anisa]KTC82858.1 polysaccharide deacetylase [Legionella cherrii]KTD01051.1 polysaccharide deacetylase [Fluoribacter gormanii]
MKSNISLLIAQALFLFCYQAFGYASEIAITFDDLPASIEESIEEQAQINQQIVNALIKYRVPAIGFVNEGKLYRTNETQEKINLLKLWVDNGFDLGNHTYSHLSLSSITTKQFKAEVTNGSKISKQLMQSAGREYRYFRHPYLDTGETFKIRSQFESFLKHEGYLVAPVTIDTDDWKFNQQLHEFPQNKDKIIQSYLKHTRAKFAFYESASKQMFGRNINQIWLLHANLVNSLAIESLLTIAQEYGYHFISLDDALQDKAYLSADSYYAHFGVSWLYRWDFTRGKVVDWSQDPEPDNNPFISTKTIKFYDKDRKRLIPVKIYVSNESQGKANAGIIKLPVAIINHGYTVRDTEYSFLANALAANGYFVVSIQHDLKSDPPLAQTGNLFERRKPLWERGSTNILYVIKELSRINPSLNLSKVTLIGHSNGGDIAMLFARNHPQFVKKIISLDSLRMPFPRTGLTPILSLRGNDTKADEGVLPSQESLKQLAITIIPLPEAKHIDLCDRGPEVIQKQMNALILKSLRG